VYGRCDSDDAGTGLAAILEFDCLSEESTLVRISRSRKAIVFLHQTRIDADH